MNEDYKEVLWTISAKFTKDQIMSELGYNETRADQVIIDMLENGLICEDKQVPAKWNCADNIDGAPFTSVYWVISLVQSDTDIDENAGIVQAR